ncbi:FmdB family zinc ribbon protein [Arhodomonas aquaeolei]|uniref:FmdB family zinc ribbon protein n=1 Tax=Arhodomonas aquaeolei TaxID=2369 RepID=UPI00036CEAD7|nr:zinc ribbon domain-containing protein [Arhodomonas aquaeolei]
MPIYEYLCDACGHELEALQSINDEPLTECPECHRPQLRKRISAAAFRLKGGGWYETDFKKDNRRNLAGDGGGGSKGDSGSSGGSGGGSGEGKKTAAS